MLVLNEKTISEMAVAQGVPKCRLEFGFQDKFCPVSKNVTATLLLDIFGERAVTFNITLFIR